MYTNFCDTISLTTNHTKKEHYHGGNLDEIKIVLKKHEYSNNTIICDVMKKFKFKTICCKSGMSKGCGYSFSEVIGLMFLLPLMLLPSVHDLIIVHYASPYKVKIIVNSYLSIKRSILLHFEIHVNRKKRKSQYKKECIKNTNGWKRRKEAYETLGGIFELVKDEIYEKTLAESKMYLIE